MSKIKQILDIQFKNSAREKTNFFQHNEEKYINNKQVISYTSIQFDFECRK